ncbi:hypothetical protein ACIA6C_15665 [Streptomyces sp. NPDC051578]|uniref:hypothetical protein n=1 Tax=unclassified Streptomyces TaxID=2593676 RepID=UPI0034025DD6
MDRAPIVVHRISPSGGRRVSFHVRGTDTILGIAYSDADVIEFLRLIEVPDPDELVLGDSPLIVWQGDGPHEYEPEPGPPPADLP